MSILREYNSYERCWEVFFFENKIRGQRFRDKVRFMYEETVCDMAFQRQSQPLMMYYCLCITRSRQHSVVDGDADGV